MFCKLNIFIDYTNNLIIFTISLILIDKNSLIRQTELNALFIYLD
ncbi:hypothetical protein yfred0001_24200 [Yersinia frederiksenii ATCC 33641]|nr:hypothetical protein yfred0001_24200 [Yersinia frederiksenii ATCC 33641]